MSSIHNLTTGENFAPERRRKIRHGYWLAMALLFSPIAHAQQVEKVQPSATTRKEFLLKPLGVVDQVGSSFRDLVKFRDPQWSALTIGQTGAAFADEVTSMNNLRECLNCKEAGIPRLVVGQRPDAQKYIVAGLLEIGIEAVTAHYFLNHGSNQKWYWRPLWLLPQSLSLFGNSQAALNNARINMHCDPTGLHCY